MTGINTFHVILRLSKPANLPEEKDRKEGRRGKEPAEVKRDQERREAWLERRTVEERSVAEVPAAAPVTEPAPVPVGGRTPAPSPSGGGPLVPGHPGLPRLKPRPRDADLLLDTLAES